MELFKLFGSVMVDNSKANQSMQKTVSIASRLGKGLGNGIKTAAKWGAGIAAGASVGGAALFGMAKKAADTGDRIDKLSQKIGLSRTGFQEWEYILSQNGASIEVLQGGMKKLNKTLDDAKSGSATAVEAFSRVGLSIDDIQNMNPEQAFEATVKALQAMPEGAEKAALANELLGRSGSELMPLLNGSAESVEELRKQAHDMGIVLSDDAVAASAKFTDTMDNVKRTLGAVTAKIGVSVMPVIQKALDWVMDHMPQIQAVMSTVFNAIKVSVETVVDVFSTYLMPVIEYVYNWIVNNWDTISTVFQTVFDNIKVAIDFVKNIIETYLIPAFKKVVDWVVNNWDKIRDVIMSVFDSVKSVIEAFVTVVTFIWDNFGKNIIKYIQIAFNTVKNVVMSVLNIIQGIIKTVTSIIKGDWKGVWDGIKQIFSGVWNGIKGIVTNSLNFLKNTISTVWNGIKIVTASVWNGIKLAIMTPINAAKNVVKGAIDSIKNMFNFKFKWPKLPMPHFSISGSMNPLKWLKEGVPKISVDWYAKGGIFSKPTIFDTASGLKGVGEKGPEAVAPISKLQEMIDWNTGISNEQANTIISLLSAILAKNSDIILNGKSLSKEIAPNINKELKLIEMRG